MSFGEDGTFTALFQGWEPETAAFDNLRIVTGRNLTKNDTRGVLLGTIKLADVVSTWITARDAAWLRASASKLARPDG